MSMLKLHCLAFLSIAAAGALASFGDEFISAGEQLDRSCYGPVLIESFDDVLARDRVMVPNPPKGRQGAHGVWLVPSIRATGQPHSGEHYVMNKWGDSRMGIGFPTPADVRGVWVVEQGGPGTTTADLRVFGYRAGQLVGEAVFSDPIRPAPAWFEIDLNGVDRIEFVARPKIDGGGWYGLDDLTYVPRADGATDADAVVVTFDDLEFETVLTGTRYAGLTWETGTGDFDGGVPMPAPQAPEWIPTPGKNFGPPPLRTRSAGPRVDVNFDGLQAGGAYPPDTMGAVGQTVYAECVNQMLAVYNKTGGPPYTWASLGAFFPYAYGGLGDPRIVWDQYAQRWFIVASEFSGGSKRIILGVSRTTSPTGFWFKTSFTPGQGSDAGDWPDYPTLAVDERGVYISSYMVGGPRTMTLFAIDKAPLLSSQLGTITAFRDLPWEGAIQPAHAFGPTTSAYLVSRDYTNNPHRIRIRRIDPPLTAPTLWEVGLIDLPYSASAPDAPALGSAEPIDTLNDGRFMMALYRDGYIWTSHTAEYNGLAACAWYQIDPAAVTIVQAGIVSDPGMHYYFPSIMVNDAGDAVMGYSGSNADQYVGCYFSGRKANDPPGAMSAPVQFKTGNSPYTLVDPYGRNRWGDYTYTTLDPTDGLTFWTIQEYARAIDSWGTWIAQIYFPDSVVRQGDMNCDGHVDFYDINPFVLALIRPSDYLTAYPDCNWHNADFTGDGVVDGYDVNPFVVRLLPQ